MLDAAEREFRDKGVTHTTLSDVAAAAGVTRGAIYWHFKDKNALFQAMCDRAFLPMQALLNEIATTPGDDPLNALRQMYVQMLTHVATNPRQRNVFDIMFHHCEKNKEMKFFAHEMEKRSECQARIEAILRKAVTQGKLAPDTDTWLAVRALHSYLSGLLHEWLLDPHAYDLKQHADAMIDLFIAGLIAHPPLKTKQHTN